LPVNRAVELSSALFFCSDQHRSKGSGLPQYLYFLFNRPGEFKQAAISAGHVAYMLYQRRMLFRMAFLVWCGPPFAFCGSSGLPTGGVYIICKNTTSKTHILGN
jgi:hypothetical protein